MDISFLAGDNRSAEQVQKKLRWHILYPRKKIAFKKYPVILKLEEMHGADINNA